VQELSQYNFKIEYEPGKARGKPDALPGREGDLPPAGEKRLTRNVGILLPKDRYWDIPETEEIRLDILETTEFRDKDDGEIQKASRNDNEIQDIKRNLDEGKTEMKGTALGLCKWKDNLLWCQGTIRLRNDEWIRTALIAIYYNPLTSTTRRDGNNYRTHQPTILLGKDKRRYQKFHQNLPHMSENQGGPTCTPRIATVK